MLSAYRAYAEKEDMFFGGFVPKRACGGLSVTTEYSAATVIKHLENGGRPDRFNPETAPKLMKLQNAANASRGG